MMRSPLSRAREPALVCAFLVLLGAPARSQTISDLTGLTSVLQPGSRAALGIGGDPFCSPVEDQDGWWEQLGLSRPPEVMVEGAWSEPLRSDVANLRRVFSSHWVVDPSFARNRLRVAGEIVAPDWHVTWMGSDGGIRLGGSGVGGRFGVRALELIPGLTLQGVSPTIGDLNGVRGPSSGAGARYRIGSRAIIQGSWERGRAPEMLRSDLYGEPVEASINLQTERTHLDAAVHIPGRLRLEGSAGWEDFRGLEERESTPVYHLAPKGWSRLAQASLAWQSPISWQVLGRYTRRELEIRGNGSWGGQKFAELSSGSAELESYLVGVEYGRSHGSRWLFDIEAVRANARARAELETWPFTSATIDLLGMRRIYRVRGEAQWHRAHVGFVHPIRNTLVSAGLSGYDIAPAGTVESWRPVFLVFGGADRQHDTLDTNRLQLVALSLGFGWTAGGTRVDLAAQQFVFAKAFRTVTRSAPDVGTTPDPSSQPSSGDSNSGWSGVEVRASLSRSFGPSTKR